MFIACCFFHGQQQKNKIKNIGEERAMDCAGRTETAGLGGKSGAS